MTHHQPALRAWPIHGCLETFHYLGQIEIMYLSNKVIGIEPVLLNVQIDPIRPSKDEQHENGVVSKRVVDVVTLLKRSDVGYRVLMVEVPEQGIAAQVLQDETVGLVLKSLSVGLRVVRVVQVNRPQAFACDLRHYYLHAAVGLRSLKRARRAAVLAWLTSSKRRFSMSSNPRVRPRSM